MLLRLPSPASSAPLEPPLAYPRSRCARSPRTSRPRLVARYGVPLVERQRASTADDTSQAAARPRAPGGGQAPRRRHRAQDRAGLVRLGLRDADAVRTAADELLASARAEDGQVDLLVARMVTGTRELVAGRARRPPVRPLRHGRDRRCVDRGARRRRVPPRAAHAIDAAEMLDDLAHPSALLGPVRGEPAVDRDALARRVAVALRPRVRRSPTWSRST